MTHPYKKPMGTQIEMLPHTVPTVFPAPDEPATTLVNTYTKTYRNSAYHTFKQYKLSLFTIILLALVAGVLLTTTTPVLYQATTQIHIKNQDSALNVNYESSQKFYQTQFELLKSQRLAKAVIKKLKLYPKDKLPQGDAGIFSTFLNGITYIDNANNELSDNKQKTISHFLESLRLEKVGNSSLININYQHKNPDQARKIANTIASEFITLDLNNRLNSTKRGKALINNQINQAKSRLKEAEKKLVHYTKKNQLTALDVKKHPATTRLEDLEKAVTKAETTRINLESDYKAYQPNNTKANLGKDSLLKSLNIKYQNKQKQYQELLQIYKPAYPKMIELDREINIIKNEIKETQALTKQISASNSILEKENKESKYLGAKKKEDSLRTKLNQQKKTLLKIKEKALGYNALQREVETQRSIYQGLLERLKEANASINIAKSNATIIDKAGLPYRPHTPNWQENLLIAGILGLFAAMVFFIYRYFSDDRIHNEALLTRHLPIPVIGRVPHTSKRLHMAYPQQEKSPEKLSFQQAFFALRTRLALAKNPAKVINITSAMPAEGKSTCCIQLASAFAHTGKRVLLIDTNTHKPSLHQKLELKNQQGLSDYLHEYHADLNSYLLTTQINNVSIITAGSKLMDPAGAFTSPAMQQLLHQVKQEFDVILLDSPATLQHIEALVLAHHADATLLVCRMKKSRIKHLQQTLQQLQHTQCNLVGLTLNGINLDYKKNTITSMSLVNH